MISVHVQQLLQEIEKFTPTYGDEDPFVPREAIEMLTFQEREELFDACCSRIERSDNEEDTRYVGHLLAAATAEMAPKLVRLLNRQKEVISNPKVALHKGRWTVVQLAERLLDLGEIKESIPTLVFLVTGNHLASVKAKVLRVFQKIPRVEIESIFDPLMESLRNDNSEVVEAGFSTLCYFFRLEHIFNGSVVQRAFDQELREEFVDLVEAAVRFRLG